jgi:hypothetical protein
MKLPILAFFNATEALFEHDEQFGILKRNSDSYVIELIPEYKVREQLPKFSRTSRIEVNTFKCLIDKMKGLAHVC